MGEEESVEMPNEQLHILRKYRLTSDRYRHDAERAPPPGAMRAGGREEPRGMEGAGGRRWFNGRGGPTV